MPAFLAAVPAIIAAATAAAGVAQTVAGAVGKPQRPVRKVPDSIRQATLAAENLASGTMPGMATAQGQIDTGTGTALNKLQQAGRLDAGSVADILAGGAEARTDLAVKGAQFKTDALGQMIQQKNVQGVEEGRLQDDALKDFTDRAVAASSLTGAGIHNIFTGLSNVAGVASYDKLYEGLFGAKKAGGAATPKIGGGQWNKIEREKLQSDYAARRRQIIQ